jgi:hypothetical protein
MIAQLVGPEGEVVGVDMTDEQLETARSHIDWHIRAFGHARPNVKFLKGYTYRASLTGRRANKTSRRVSGSLTPLNRAISISSRLSITSKPLSRSKSAGEKSLIAEHVASKALSKISRSSGSN